MTKPWETAPPPDLNVTPVAAKPWETPAPADAGGPKPWEQPVPTAAGAKPWETPAPADAGDAAARPVASATERFGTGLMDPVHGLTQLLYNVVPESVNNGVNDLNEWLIAHGIPLASIPGGDINRFEAEREAAIRATEPEGIDWARMVGNVASPVTLATPQLRGLGMLGNAALMGGVGAATQPVADIPEGTDYAHEKAKEILTGAGFGAGTGAAGALASKLVKPIWDRSVQYLLDNGVKLTPGQLAGPSWVGKGVRGVEDKATSTLIPGAAIQGAQKRSIESFNRAVLNKSLAEIGKTLPSIEETGRPALKYTRDQIGRAYDRILPNLRFVADRQFNTDLSALRTLASTLPDNERKGFERFVQEYVLKRLGPQGNMDGQTFKTLEADLRPKVNAYLRAAGSQHELGTAYQELQNILRQGLMRSNPANASELQQINKAYAIYVRARDASFRRAGNEGGIFTPVDLLTAIRSGSSRNQYAAGDALIQDFADAANIVLPSRVPNSGTADRLLQAGATGAAGGGLGAAALMGHPGAALAALGAATGSAAPYVPWGQNALNWWARPGAIRGTLSDVIRTATPAAAAGAGAASTRGE